MVAEGPYVCHLREPLDQAHGLPAAVSAEQRVNLIDDHKAQIPEEGGNLRVLAHQERLQRLRCDLKDPRGMLEKPSLFRGRHIPVPMPDRDLRLLAEIIQAEELVVDQRLQRCDIDAADRQRLLLHQQRQNRKKSRLRLAGCGRGTEKDVVLCPKDRVPCRHLNPPEILPAVLIDKVLNKGRIAPEYIQASSPPFLKSGSCERLAKKLRLVLFIKSRIYFLYDHSVI